MMQRTVTEETERILPILGENQPRLAAAIVNFGLLAGITSGSESAFYTSLADNLLIAFQTQKTT